MLSQTSLKRWVDRYNEDGNVSRKQREYESYKVRRTHVTSAINELRKQQTISMKELSRISAAASVAQNQILDEDEKPQL